MPGTAPRNERIKQIVVVGACGLLSLVALASQRGRLRAVLNASDAPSQPASMSPLPSGAPPLDPTPPSDDPEDACHFDDRGFGDYEPYKPAGKGRVLVPRGRAVRDDGGFALLVHFHGSEPIRRQLAPEGLDLVIATVDAGVGSAAYSRAFTDPDAFLGIVSAAEEEVAKAHELPSARAFPILLSSWSAGYGAVFEILSQAQRPINGVVLLDSLYASYRTGSHEVDPERLGPFLALAKSAVASDGPAMFLAYSEITPPGYASTGEVANYMLSTLGLSATEVSNTGDPFGLLHVADKGAFHVRGYAGNTSDAHCAALRLLVGALREHVLPGLGGATKPHR